MKSVGRFASGSRRFRAGRSVRLRQLRYNPNMRFTHRLALLAVVLLSAVELRAQNSPWFEARSAHFLLFTDTSAAKGRQLLADFESRVAELEKAFGAVPARQFPIEVFLFKKAEDFTEAVPMAEATEKTEKAAYLFRG